MGMTNRVNSYPQVNKNAPNPFFSRFNILKRLVVAVASKVKKRWSNSIGTTCRPYREPIATTIVVPTDLVPISTYSCSA